MEGRRSREWLRGESGIYCIIYGWEHIKITRSKK